jgi:hydrophobe/amphiphile efflux-3 (HAE3) family protein
MATVHKFLEKIFTDGTALVIRWKYIILIVTLLLTGGLAAQMANLKIDTRDESFFHADDPTLIAYNHFRDTFGQDDMFIIALKPEAGFTREFLATLYGLHHELAESVPYLDDINSLVNGRITRAEGDTLIVEDLMPRPPQSEAELQRIRHLIGRYPLYENLLVSPDRSLTTILIKARAIMEPTGEEVLAGFDEVVSPENRPGPDYLSNEQNVEIYTAIRKVTAKYAGQGVEFYYGGTPAFVAEIQKGIEKDLGAMIPLSFMMIVIFLALLFRRLSGVIYPLLIVFLSLTASMGIMALVGIPITNVIQILPMFLIVVGIGDSVHILTIFYRIHRESGDKHQAIIQAVGYAGLPVLMTSVTTACGLISFVWADVANIAQLGYIAPVGVMLAFIYTIVLLPALICIFPIKQPRPMPGGKQPVADRIFDAITALTTRHAPGVLIVSGLLIGVAGYQASAVKFSHNAMTWFPESAVVRRSTELLDRVNGGTVMLEVIVDTNRDNGLQNPDVLNRMDQAAAHIADLEVHGIRAGKVWSLADVTKEINRALHADRDTAYTLPDTRQKIAQELILFESSGSDDLEEVTDGNYRKGRLSILAPFTDSVLYKDYVDAITVYLERQFPSENVWLTGHMSLFVQITKHFLTSMAKSYVFALIVITFLMVLMIGRVRVGLMSMVANVAPILLVFGIMGSCNIPLDMSTILIGSIVLGLVVDDTIHFLHHFRRAFDETGNVTLAVSETLHATGRALVITSLVLCGGFFIYMTSYLACNTRFGLLAGCGVLFALAADFFIVPAMLTLVYGNRRNRKGDGITVTGA